MIYKKLQLNVTIFLISCLWQHAYTQYSNEKYSHFHYEENTLTVQTNRSEIRFELYRPNILKVSRSRSNGLSNAVILNPAKINGVVKEDSSAIYLTTDSLHARFDKSNLTLSLSKSGIKDYIYQELKRYENDSSLGIQISLRSEEKITGGGARALPLNRRGYRLKLYNEPHWGYGWGEENLNFSIPWFISSGGYGIFWDNPGKGMADIGYSIDSIFELSSCCNPSNYYIVANSSFNELINSFYTLTGTQPLPPRWALGNLQSRFGYRNQEEVLSMANNLLKNDYPLDAMILDLFWFGRGREDWRMGDLTWDTKFWPSPENMINSLKQSRIKTILITEPYILQSSINFKEADSLKLFALDSTGTTGIIEDFYFGPAGLIDIFNPDACSWFWQKYNKQIDIGIDGWWGDLGEPEKHPSFLIHSAGTSDAIHNIYGHYWSKMLSDKYAQNYPNIRLFHLNRSGYAGSQRYSIFPWSGDVGRSWAGLKAQIPIMLVMNMSGIPYMHSDLGGFAAGEKDEELYTRWLQMGTFNPVFRPHGEGIPSEPLFYKSKTQRIVREFIKLRYKLTPYNYTMAWQQTTERKPLIRHVTNINRSFSFPDDDKYMWGDNLLVFPVVEHGISSISARFPNGNWYHLFTGEKYVGGQNIFFKTDVTNYPVFAKAGSFIPTVPVFYTMDKYTSERFIIHYFYDTTIEKSECVIYEDDGLNAKSYEENKYELIQISVKNSLNKLDIEIESNNGYYHGKPEEREIIMVIHNCPFQKYKALNDDIIKVKYTNDYNLLSYFKFKSDPVLISFKWNGERKNVTIYK